MTFNRKALLLGIIERNGVFYVDISNDSPQYKELPANSVEEAIKYVKRPTKPNGQLHGYTMFSNDILDRLFKVLSPEAVVIFSLIIRQTIGFGRDYCYYPQVKFVADSSIGSTNTVHKAVLELVERGLVEVDRPGKCNRYTILTRDFLTAIEREDKIRRGEEYKKKRRPKAA